MKIELSPAQPPEVEHAVTEALADGPPEPDPWWLQGLQEAIGA